MLVTDHLQSFDFRVLDGWQNELNHSKLTKKIIDNN